MTASRGAPPTSLRPLSPSPSPSPPPPTTRHALTSQAPTTQQSPSPSPSPSTRRQGLTTQPPTTQQSPSQFPSPSTPTTRRGLTTQGPTTQQSPSPSPSTTRQGLTTQPPTTKQSPTTQGPTTTTTSHHPSTKAWTLPKPTSSTRSWVTEASFVPATKLSPPPPFTSPISNFTIKRTTSRLLFKNSESVRLSKGLRNFLIIGGSVLTVAILLLIGLAILLKKRPMGKGKLIGFKQDNKNKIELTNIRLDTSDMEQQQQQQHQQGQRQDSQMGEEETEIKTVAVIEIQGERESHYDWDHHFDLGQWKICTPLGPAILTGGAVSNIDQISTPLGAATLMGGVEGGSGSGGSSSSHDYDLVENVIVTQPEGILPASREESPILTIQEAEDARRAIYNRSSLTAKLAWDLQNRAPRATPPPSPSVKTKSATLTRPKAGKISTKSASTLPRPPHKPPPPPKPSAGAIAQKKSYGDYLYL